jgi:head-tail adaptor
MPSGGMNDLIRVERPVADQLFDGAGSGAWVLVDEVWAEVQDVLPSRGERASNGFNMATHPARVRMHFRDDITSDMRFIDGAHVMQIISGPARIERGARIEFMVEDYTSAGNAA